MGHGVNVFHDLEIEAQMKRSEKIFFLDNSTYYLRCRIKFRRGPQGNGNKGENYTLNTIHNGFEKILVMKVRSGVKLVF